MDKRQAMEAISEGQVLQGTVKNITNYGAFVDIGGVDGLLHISEMSWERINHPSDFVNVGDSIEVKVVSVDRDKNRISLSTKQLTENPGA